MRSRADSSFAPPFLFHPPCSVVTVGRRYAADACAMHHSEPHGQTLRPIALACYEMSSRFSCCISSHMRVSVQLQAHEDSHGPELGNFSVGSAHHPAWPQREVSDWCAGSRQSPW